MESRQCSEVSQAEKKTPSKMPTNPCRGCSLSLHSAPSRWWRKKGRAPNLGGLPATVRVRELDKGVGIAWQLRGSRPRKATAAMLLSEAGASLFELLRLNGGSPCPAVQQQQQQQQQHPGRKNFLFFEHTLFRQQLSPAVGMARSRIRAAKDHLAHQPRTGLLRAILPAKIKRAATLFNKT